MKSKLIMAVALMFMAVPAFAQHSVTVTWTASTYVSTGTKGIAYELFEGITPGGETATPVNSTPYQCTTSCALVTTLNLVEGVTYYFVVKTIDLTSNTMGPASNEAAALIPVTVVPPTAPTNVKAVAK